MKAGTKKIIEIGLLVANLAAFIVINLFALRKFHWISVIIMVVPILITVLFLMKYDYVDWKKEVTVCLAASYIFWHIYCQ